MINSLQNVELTTGSENTENNLEQAEAHEFTRGRKSRGQKKKN